MTPMSPADSPAIAAMNSPSRSGPRHRDNNRPVTYAGGSSALNSISASLGFGFGVGGLGLGNRTTFSTATRKSNVGKDKSSARSLERRIAELEARLSQTTTASASSSGNDAQSSSSSMYPGPPGPTSSIKIE